MKKAILLMILTLGACDEMADSSMNTIKHQVAQDAVDQYNIAARQGDAMQKCVQAGMVRAAYLQAEDEAQYNVWKSRERVDCAAAGVPQ